MQTRFLHPPLAPVAVILALCGLFSIRPAAAATTPAQYKAISELKVGSLSIREVKVTSVSIKGSAGTAGSETVSLHLTGIVSLLCNERPCLSGLISQEGGGASLIGEFTWKGNDISELHLDLLKMKLIQWKVSTTLFGGTLEPVIATILSIENLSPIDFSEKQTQGMLHLTIPGGVVKSAHFEIADFVFSADLASSAPVEIEIYVGSGDSSVTAGNFKSESKLTVTSNKQLVRLFANHQIEPNNVELSGVSIAIPSSKISIAGLSITNPQIARTDYPKASIAKVAALKATDISGRAFLNSHGITLGNPTVGGLRVFADPAEVANRLNQQWVQDPDPLIATGDPTIHFIQFSALANLYQGLADADRDPKTLHRVYLKTEGDLITGSKTEFIPLKTSTIKGDEPKICLIFDGKIAAGVATVLTTLLLNEVIIGPTLFKGAYSGYLTLATLAPRLGTPAFYSVWGTTLVLNAMAGNEITHFITNSAKESCEVLLGHGPSPEVVILQPPVDDASLAYNEQAIARYENYMATRRAAGLNTTALAQGPSYQFLQKDSAARARYNNLVDLRQKTWASKHEADIQQLKSAEMAYRAGLNQRMAEVASQNAVSGHNATAQVLAQMERQRAIQNTTIITTTPTPNPDPTLKGRYYISAPGTSTPGTSTPGPIQTFKIEVKGQ